MYFCIQVYIRYYIIKHSIVLFGISNFKIKNEKNNYQKQQQQQFNIIRVIDTKSFVFKCVVYWSTAE